MKIIKKDILFLCQFFYPENNSSATLPFDTARYLREKGFSVDALCGYPKEYSAEGRVPIRETVGGVGITRLRYIQLPRRSKLGRLINYFSFTFSAVLRVFKLSKYKCVITYSNPPVLPIAVVLANKLFGTKFVFVAYDVYPEVAYASQSLKKGDLIDKVMHRLNRSIYSRASMVVALTDEMRQFLLENRPELSQDRVCTIANWAHEENLNLRDERGMDFGYTDEDFVVAYFGNMGIVQEMETLLGAMKALRNEPHIKFLLVGHGTKKEYIERFVDSEALNNVKIYGFLTGKDFVNAVDAASCCVVTLENGMRGKCAPSKYYSCLQGGKPLLTVTERGSYLVEETERACVGRSVEIGDVDTLCTAISELSGDRRLCAEMGARAMELYEKEYSAKISLNKYCEMLKTII